MDGFKRPNRPQRSQPLERPQVTPPTVPLPEPEVPPTIPSEGTVPEPPSSKFKHRRLLYIVGGVVASVIALIVVAWFWYQAQLSAVDPSNTDRVSVVIAENSSPSLIAEQLRENDLIRSAEAFRLYVKLNGSESSLQAGAYRLSPSESTPEIVEHLSSGIMDTFDITFLPGATLADNREVLLEAGYSEDEIDAGFTAEYDSVVFAAKPASADLEGLIYGETYRFGADATVEDIIAYTLQEYDRVIEENNLVAGFKEQGLSLYEGIILASIIQREAIGGDEAQIAQVFLRRLSIDMNLGSDVTYQYIADKTGVERDINLDSPYNTRRYAGLPPGPIAAPGVNSLIAVANPASGDYLFFLSGDDDVTYFARTAAEHEANIQEHCKVKCQII